MLLPENIVKKLMSRAFDAGHKQGSDGLLTEIEASVRDEFCTSLLACTIEVIEHRKEIREMYGT